MKYILLFLMTFSTSTFANNSVEMVCHNQKFLVRDFVLTQNEFNGLKKWNLYVGSEDACELYEYDSANSKTFLKPLNQDSANCKLANLSKPGVTREINSLVLNEKLMNLNKGYAMLALDNEFANYGPREITSFVYCR